MDHAGFNPAGGTLPDVMDTHSLSACWSCRLVARIAQACLRHQAQGASVLDAALSLQ